MHLPRESVRAISDLSFASGEFAGACQQMDSSANTAMPQRASEGEELVDLILEVNGPPIHELFEARARRHPGVAAVVCGDESLTYAQLNERADALARYLIHRGLEQNDLVGLCLERSVEYL